MGNSQTSEDTNKKSPDVKISEKEYKNYLKYKNSLDKKKKVAKAKEIIKPQDDGTHYNNKQINKQIDSGVQDYQYFNSNIQYDRNAYQNFGIQSKDDPRFRQDTNKLLEKEMSTRNLTGNSSQHQNNWGNNYNKIKQNFTQTSNNNLVNDYTSGNYSTNNSPAYNNNVNNFNNTNNFNNQNFGYSNPVTNYSQEDYSHHTNQPTQNMYYSNFTGSNKRQNRYGRIQSQQTSLNNFNKPTFLPNNTSNQLQTSKDKFTKEEKLLMINNQITLYDLDPLGLLKTEKLTLKQLYNKYLSLRKLYHPDKGGNTQQFILINSAIKKNIFLQNGLNSDKQFNTLKNNYNSSLKNEVKNRPIGFDQNGGFSVQKFNKFFSDNRFNDENESVGYGHMMIPSSKKREDIEIKKKPTLEKNFNKGFINHKKAVSKEIVRYKVPTAINNDTGFKTLGKMSDNFTGYSNSLNYSDYKDAYDESNLINEEEYKIQKKSLEDVKREREEGSLELSNVQKEAIEEFEKKKSKDEFKRKQSFNKYTESIKEHHKNINSLLLK